MSNILKEIKNEWTLEISCKEQGFQWQLWRIPVLNVSHTWRTEPGRVCKMESKNSSLYDVVKSAKSVIINFLRTGDIDMYELLIRRTKECEMNDDDLRGLLSDIREIISLMDQNMHHYVEVLLSLHWFKRDHVVFEEYQSFLIDLVSAHNYYVNFALEKLVCCFYEGSTRSEWASGLPTSEEKYLFEKVHEVLKILMKIVPMSCKIFLQILTKQFPYYKKSARDHEAYIYNLLKIIDYRPEFRLDILFLIVNRVVYLDVCAPKAEIEDFEHQPQETDDCNSEQEIFTMDVCEDQREKSSKGMVHPIANTLDVVLRLIFKYIHSVCHHKDKSLDWESAKGLYQDLVVVFEQVILPTHNTYHVQFIMFYICSFKVSLAEAFLNFLWLKVSSPNEAPVIRQTAIVYIASFLARATFIPLSILKDVIAKSSTWIHNYISNQNGLECGNSNIQIHAVFFSVCQALFYIIAFRHRDLVDTKKNLTFLQSLNLTKMVTCRLNPLKVCIPPVVQNFATVTRTYQLAYCYTVIEHNSRNFIPVVYRDEGGIKAVVDYHILETFFPFDPYVLKRSSRPIRGIYREYRAAPISSKNVAPLEQTTCLEEEDDFLMDQLPGTSSVTSPDIFSYGASPGFKHTI